MDHLRSFAPQLIILLTSLSSVTLVAQETARGITPFESRVAPILIARCLDCHSGDNSAGGLDLTTSEGLLRGSKTGAVLDTNDPRASVLMEMLADGSMPPGKNDRLTPEELKTLLGWVEQGAKWAGGPLTPGSVTNDRRAGFDWWSLRPIRKPIVPTIKDHSFGKSEIDSFVLSRLAAAKITPNVETDRRTWLRRVTFDLHGLPPTPEEHDAFLLDATPNSYEKVVDRLLESPRFGERWARHWLDVVRFAESHGYEHDDPRPSAWRYRDYVIEAFNTDIPYDRFLTQQIAGDVSDPGDPKALTATGFLVAGPFDQVGSKVKSELMLANVRIDELEDVIGVTGQTFLGLTLQCARCHNHKFDPISQADFYRFAAIFAGVKHGGADSDKAPIYAPVHLRPPETKLLHRGDVQAPGKSIAPGPLSSLAGIDSAFMLANPNHEGERRLALARWMISPQNPLTARVIVNRIWQHHFGQGIVTTPSDFGFNGGRPSHPELLDWLASELIEGGWKLKRLHKMIVLSTTYRRSSRWCDESAQIDTENRLLWRVSPRRLEAEEIRDAALSVSGQLNPSMGGPGFSLFDFKTNAGTLYKFADRDGPEYRRRSIYRTVVRGLEDPLLNALDCPDASTTTPTRVTTSTPLQALALWNDKLIHRQAEAFANRLKSEFEEPRDQVSRVYRLAFGRSATGDEIDRGLPFIAKHGLARYCHVLLNANEFVIID